MDLLEAWSLGSQCPGFTSDKKETMEGALVVSDPPRIFGLDYFSQALL